MIARKVDWLVLESATRLDYALCEPMPLICDDRAGHSVALKKLADAVQAEGGVICDDPMACKVRIGGFSASSTTGLIGAVRNWITSVRKKAQVQR